MGASGRTGTPAAHIPLGRAGSGTTATVDASLPRADRRRAGSSEPTRDVVNELVGVKLDKQAQSSDWSRVEELSEGRLADAAGDVRGLLAARDRLETMLKREERWDPAWVRWP